MTCKTQLIFPLFANPIVPPCSPTTAKIHLTTTNRNRYRRGLIAKAAASASSSMELPLLPFTLEEVFVPSETKTLLLYEARYLALLEESLSRKNKLFVHFVLEPISVSDFSAEVSFAAMHECLVLIENVEQLEVGALVSIRGIGRVKIVKFVEVEPYLKGIVTPVQDKIGDNVSMISSKVEDVKEALRRLNSLEVKLKTSKEEFLQTNAAKSLSLVEEEQSVDCHSDFVPPLTERISFAPFRAVSGASKSDLMKLNSLKIRAMNLRDTQQRLDCSLDLIKKNISLIAAKLAIQSLDKQ